MRLYNMIGYKLFKQNEDGSVHMLRIVHMHRPFKITDSTKDPTEITVYDYDTKEKRKVKVDTLSEYSPLQPDGILTFNIATIASRDGKTSSRDVIVTATKFLNVELKISNIPYAVCRQSITDIFYNLLSTNDNDELVGLSVNQDTCPSNFDFRMMLACNDITYSEFINFYRTDSLEDILEMCNTQKFDDVLSDLYNKHVEAVKDPMLSFKNEHGGWCKNLKLLLEQNNFQTDINQMLGITEVDFEIAPYLEEHELPGKEDVHYLAANDELRYWMSLQYKVNIVEANFLEYDHDINLGDFNNTGYFLFKDNTKKLYLIVYRIKGEYFESDLIAKDKELDFSTKFKIKFNSSKFNKK